MAEKVESFADNASFQRGITRVPFSQTTVRHLMVLQTRHDIHPYTCGNRGDGKHEKIGGQSGILVPTVNGWVCPDCDYTQDWVHNSFLNAIIFDVAFDEPTHAPASTATSEVIEKYARDLRMHNETRPLANTREKQEETLRAILTRFASEIGTVDAGLLTATKAMILLVEDYEAKTCKVIRAAITIGKSDWQAEAKERELAMHKIFEFLDVLRAALSAQEPRLRSYHLTDIAKLLDEFDKETI